MLVVALHMCQTCTLQPKLPQVPQQRRGAPGKELSSACHTCIHTRCKPSKLAEAHHEQQPTPLLGSCGFFVTLFQALWNMQMEGCSSSG